MESSSHGSGADGTIPDAPSLQSTTITLEPDLPTSSLELGDSIEILSATDAEDVSSALTAVPTTESSVEEPGKVTSTTVEEEDAVPTEPPATNFLNPLAESFIPTIESSIATLLSGPEPEVEDDFFSATNAEAATEKTDSIEKTELLPTLDASVIDGEVKEEKPLPDDVDVAATTSVPKKNEDAEIKDDIVISQTVEILEPVLADSKLRGDSPLLELGDLEDDKERKEFQGVELSSDDIADDDDDDDDDDEVRDGVELSSIPKEVVASIDSLATAGTESPVMVSPPLSDDGGGRTPKNSQGSEAGNSSGFEMISSGERSPVEEPPAIFLAGSSEDEIVIDVAATVAAAKPPLEVKTLEEATAAISGSLVDISETIVEAASETPVEVAPVTTSEEAGPADNATAAATVDLVEGTVHDASDIDITGVSVQGTADDKIAVTAAAEAPLEVAVEEPVEGAVEEPVEAVAEVPVEVVAEAPLEVVSEEPLEVVSEAPLEVVAEAPVEAVAEASVEAAAETPVEVVAEAPVEVVAELPVEAVAEALADAVVEAPDEAISGAPVEAVSEAPVEAVVEAIAEAVAEVPVEADAESPAAAAVGTDAQDEAEEPVWEDILGSGTLMKKTVIKSDGEGDKPTVGQVVTVMTEGKLEDGTQIDLNEKLEFTIGDHDVIQAFELVTRMLRVGDVVEVKTDPKFAYGKLGRAPDVPPDAHIHYVVALLELNPPLEFAKMPASKRLSHGLAKKERGNVLYKREEYSQAIVSYTKAVKIFDEDAGGGGGGGGESGDSGGSPSELQKLLDEKMKVYNNLAATQMKLLAYDSAIKSCDAVIKLQPNNVKALFRKGQALESKKDTAEALVYFKRSLKLDPNSKRIKQDVDRLSKLAKQQEDKEKKLYAKMLGTTESPKQEAKKESLLGRWTSWFGSWAIAVAGTAALVGFTVVAVKSLS